MTAEWITKLASEKYPTDSRQSRRWNVMQAQAQAGLIAGVELGLAKAAELADEYGEPGEDITTMPEVFDRAWCRSARSVAEAIRALGSDENGETT